jgi:hypothetical protein
VYFSILCVQDNAQELLETSRFLLWLRSMSRKILESTSNVSPNGREPYKRGRTAHAGIAIIRILNSVASNKKIMGQNMKQDISHTKMR